MSAAAEAEHVRQTATTDMVVESKPLSEGRATNTVGSRATSTVLAFAGSVARHVDRPRGSCPGDPRALANRVPQSPPKPPALGARTDSTVPLWLLSSCSACHCGLWRACFIELRPPRRAAWPRKTWLYPRRQRDHRRAGGIADQTATSSGCSTSAAWQGHVNPAAVSRCGIIPAIGRRG